MKEKTILCSVAFLGSLALAQAAPITWTAGPSPIVDQNSISLNGSPSHAGSWGSPKLVSIVPVGSKSVIFGTAGNNTGDLTGFNAACSSGNYRDGGVWIPTATVDSVFESIIDGFSPDGANPKVVIVGGLVVGKSYQIQLFVSDDRNPVVIARTMKFSDSATLGTGNETAAFAMGDSVFVTGTFTATATTQTIYGFGVAQQANGVNAYVLRDLSPDTDGDGIPDHIEDAYPTVLNKNNPADAAADPLNSGLSNLVRYQLRLDLTKADHDGDGLTDGAELNNPTFPSNPKLVDSDGDTLSDDKEVLLYLSNPLSSDSDGDRFPDRYEVAALSSPSDPNSTPGGLFINFQANLYGAQDLTDPENDINSTTGANSNWVSISAATSGSPSDSSFALLGAGHVFDNKITNANPTATPPVPATEWAGNGLPRSVTVQFSKFTSLDYFTVSCGPDGNRDPRVWEIQGSNDGTNFATIAKIDYPVATLWSDRTKPVMVISLPGPSLPYKYFRYLGSVTGGSGHEVTEIEYFGSQDDTDTDADGIPALYENFYSTFLSDGNAADAALDQDGDGLSNLREFQLGLDPTVADTDGDGLNDGAEVNTHLTNPRLADTDGDGLSDLREVTDLYGGVRRTSPLLKDTDGDGFDDPWEIAKGSDPTLASSRPFGITVEVLGTGTTKLLGKDFTDRANDGNDTTELGSGFDWLSITASSKANFFNPVATNGSVEGAFNIFDNKVGGGEAKWCCDPAPTVAAPQSVTVRMAYGVKMTHFTVTSSNDTPERDPRNWAIQGSNDGVNFTDIFAQNDPNKSFWLANRDQVIKFTRDTPAPMYTYFRYIVYGTGTGAHALGEIEYFGIDQDTDNDGMPDYFEAKYPFLNLNSAADANLDFDGDGVSNLNEFLAGTDPSVSNTAVADLKVTTFGFNGAAFQLTVQGFDITKSYKLRRSIDLVTWADVGVAFTPTNTTQMASDPAPPAGRAFYRIERVTPP